MTPPILLNGLASEGRTHVGTVRKRNEDVLVARPELGLWAVADGAGGHGMGDVASAAVAEALAAVPPGLSAAELLAQFRLRLAGVNAALQQRATQMGEGRMVATTIVALLARHGHYACLWAGDSRAYLLRGGGFTRLTRDHSLVQEMVDRGDLSEAAADRHPHANIITRAVGGEGPLEMDKVSGHIHPGDLFLLCSDGLFKALPEEEVARHLRQGGGASELIDAALAARARDNVSAIVVQAVPDADLTLIPTSRD